MFYTGTDKKSRYNKLKLNTFFFNTFSTEFWSSKINLMQDYNFKMLCIDVRRTKKKNLCVEFAN